MRELLPTALGQFRIISITEGISYLVLLFIAMPLKYWADIPMAVRIVGSAHGFLFIVYMVALLRVWMEEEWKIWKVVTAFILSVIPFGAFVFEVPLKREWRQRYGTPENNAP